PLARLPGIYTLDILGYNGCPAQDTAIVYYTDPLPNLSALGDTIDCIDTVGNVAFMTDAAPGYSFRWLDPGGRINNNAAIQTTLVGPYQIEIIDINGCLAIARAEIDIDTISVGQMITGGIISCLEPSTQLTLDTIYPFLGYSWSFDSLFVSDQPEPLVDTGGIFTLTTTNINGCQRHINYQVEADTVSPDFDLADHDLNCENTRLTLGPSRTNGSWSYFWTGPGDFTLNKPFPTITGPGRYTLTATGPNGCSRSVSSDIHADFEAPVVTLDSTFLPCNSDSASLSFVTTDSLKETNWFGPDGYYRSTVDAATDAAGWYYILAKGFNGCEALDSQFVSAVPLLAPLSISSQKIDCTHSTGYVQIDSSYADYRYLILTESNDTITSGFTQALDAQTYRIVAEHLPSGCVLQDSIDIPADTMPPFLRILEMDSIICEHREIRLGSEVDTAVLYQWSTLDGRLIGPTQNEVARLDVPGTYTLTVSSISNDCISESSVLIEEKFSNLQQMFLSANDASCDGEDDAIIIIDSILGGQGPFTFSINDEYFSSRNVFPFLHPDLYRIYLKDVNGCALDTTIMVGRYPDFSLSLGDDEIFVNLGDSVTLQASVGLNPLDIERITWLLPDSVSCQDCLEQQLFPTDNRSYLVSVTSVNGCTRQDTVFIRVADPDRIFVPNAFTPNGDGINDFAEVFTGNEVEFISSFEVYDRWGNSVFLASDFSPGAVNARWDGSYRGQPLNPGVYIYLLKVVDIRGTVKSKVGEINLLR
ncbi:MAG: gliding motility-associated C-terminal domain-containing protein, partial [Saprospiraceae bacterium]|nr:gliding motility-associated C-terminal domain-containing protein [Saprospiraceae bacterium]